MSYLFNNDADRLHDGTDGGSSLAIDKYTLMVWYRWATSGGHAQPRLMGRLPSASTPSHMAMILSTGTGSGGGDILRQERTSGVERLYLMSSGPFSRDSAWHHYLATYDIDGLGAGLGLWRAWLDGNEVTNTATGSAESGVIVPNAGTIFTLGGLLPTDDSRSFAGHMAHACIWNRVLTTQEVADLAAGADPTTVSGRLRYWPLTSDSATQVDETGSGHDLTVYGSTFSADEPPVDASDPDPGDPDPGDPDPPAGSYLDEVKADNLRAVYMFEGSGTAVEDDSGNGLHATLSGGATRIAGPTSGLPNAVSFDGTNGFLNLGDLLGFRTGYHLSAAVGFYFRSTEARAERYLMGSNEHPRLQIQLNRGGVFGTWEMRATHETLGNIARCEWTAPETQDGEWHHIGMSWTAGGELLLMVDGVAKAPSTVIANTANSDTFPEPENDIYFGGRDSAGLDDPAEADVAGLAIFDDPVSEQRFQAHYAAAGSETESPPNVISAVSGAITPNSGRVKLRLSGVGDNPPELKLSINEELSSPVATVQGTPTADGVYDFQFSGLDPQTTYHYGFDAREGQFKTSAHVLAPFSIGLGSCNSPGTHPNTVTFMRTAQRSLDFFLHMGDWGYPDPTANDVELLYTNYKQNLAEANQQTMWRSTPLVYTWDDHDFGPNNSDSSAASRPASLQAYREYMPHHPMQFEGPANDTPIGHAFTHNGVRFVIPDTRSESVFYGRSLGEGEILGPDQLAWVLDEIESLTEPVMVLSVQFPWIVTPGHTHNTVTDNWAHAYAEREAICDAIEAHAKGRVILTHGDMHAVAMDDGTNTYFGSEFTSHPSPIKGPPLFAFAPLGRGNSTKGGPYSEGVETGSNHQYGTLEFVPHADGVTVIGRGWDATTETEVMTMTVEVEADVSAWAPDAVITDIADTTYLDNDVEAGKWYRYRVATADTGEPTSDFTGWVQEQAPEASENISASLSFEHEHTVDISHSATEFAGATVEFNHTHTLTLEHSLGEGAGVVVGFEHEHDLGVQHSSEEYASGSASFDHEHELLVDYSIVAMIASSLSFNHGHVVGLESVSVEYASADIVFGSTHSVGITYKTFELLPPQDFGVTFTSGQVRVDWSSPGELVLVRSRWSGSGEPV